PGVGAGLLAGAGGTDGLHRPANVGPGAAAPVPDCAGRGSPAGVPWPAPAHPPASAALGSGPGRRLRLWRGRRAAAFGVVAWAPGCPEYSATPGRVLSGR